MDKHCFPKKSTFSCSLIHPEFNNWVLTETQLDWGEMKGQRGNLTHSQLKAKPFNAAYL